LPKASWEERKNLGFEKGSGVVLGERKPVALLVALIGLTFCIVLLVVSPSEAQQDLDCSDFDFQEDAQEELESDRSDSNNLDADNDGIACETLPRRGGAENNTNDGNATEDTGDDEADESNVSSAQQNQGENSADRSAASQSSARAGGAFAQSSSNERPDQRRRDRVIKGTIPKKRLPPTGGPSVCVVVTGSVLVSMGLLGLGLVIRRGPRG
jgi:hypothetical protein